MFGELIIPMHTDNAKERRHRVAEQRARIEREAAKRLAREEDPPFVDL